jgi:hypothetical protein
MATHPSARMLTCILTRHLYIYGIESVHVDVIKPDPQIVSPFERGRFTFLFDIQMTNSELEDFTSSHEGPLSLELQYMYPLLHRACAAEYACAVAPMRRMRAD